jgi:S1-C subfamily serine protease
MAAIPAPVNPQLWPIAPTGNPFALSSTPALPRARHSGKNHLMTTPVVRRIAILGLALLSLPGCTNKKDQAKIKELEAQIETLQEETSTSLNERDKELSQKDEASSKAQNDAEQKILQLTAERDKAQQELDLLKKAAARAETARIASLPKDASSPGHPDFNPANEAKITQALATVTGDKSTGTGFVVASEGKQYLYTAAHVVAGNSRLSISNSAGLKFTKFGNLEVADGTAIVRLELLDATEAPALQLAAESTKVAAATDLTALSASAASGTVTSDRGNAIAQSEDAIDVDPSLLQGKSGGPLIATATGKVLAVIINPAAERSELGTAPASGEEIPNRACRLNRKLQWKAVPIGTFLAEAKKISEYDSITRVAQALAVLSPSSTGLGVEGTVAGGQTALAVLTAAKDVPVAAEVLAMHNLLSGKKNVRSSEADLKKRFASLISSALSQMQRSSEGFDPAKFTSYHRRLAENSLKWRKEALQQLKGSGSGTAE